MRLSEVALVIDVSKFFLFYLLFLFAQFRIQTETKIILEWLFLLIRQVFINLVDPRI